MFPVPVSKTKIIPPRRRSELLARRRLLSSLFDALDNKLVLVSAPAGYGKTSLLIDVAGESEFKCCWLSLDELDRDPRRFLAYMVASITERFPGVGGQTAAVMSRVDSFEDEMERLAVTLVNETYESIHEHFVLILDDFHILEGVQPIYDFLNRFIQLVDDNCHVVVSSRTLTTLADLPLMVAREQVSGLSFADLAFRADEIQALILKNHNQHISDEEAQRLIDETEGWITGLQFSENVISQNDMTKPALKTGVNLFDYLGQQVVDKQKPHIFEFILRTSLMDEFDAGLCEAVLAPLYAEKQDWQAFIQTVLKNNLFAIPVGVDGRSLRYHHLFRDYLRQRMEKERAEEVRPILERLSRAYEALEEWERAYAIIRSLGDTQALIELIDISSFNALYDKTRLIETWLQDLPPSVLKNNPCILSTTGTLKLIKGDSQAGIVELNKAIEIFRTNADIPHLALSLIRRSFGHRYLGDYQTALLDAEDAIQLIEDRDDLQFLYAEALQMKASILSSFGQFRTALKLFEKMLDIYIHLDKQEKALPRLFSEIGTLNYQLGVYDEAEKNFNKALNIYKTRFDLIEEASLLNNIGFMYHNRGMYEKASFTFERGLLCAQRSQHARLQALLSVSIGDLYAELQDVEIAEQNYAHAEQLIQELDYSFLFFSLHVGRANLALSQGDFLGTENLINEIAEITAVKQSHNNDRILNLLRGKFYLLTGKVSESIEQLEQAETAFLEDGLMIETISARVWLAAAYIAGSRPENALETIQEVLDKPQHVTWLAAHQVKGWLESLRNDPNVGRGVRDILLRGEKLFARIPAVRREIRRQARVVEVPIAHLVIKGLGNSAVIVGGRELAISDWQTQSVRELFFFFLTQTRPLTKEQVAEQFWPELDDPAKMRLRFKNEMYRLRRAVGNDAILYENNAYSFNRRLNYEYDVEAFESHLVQARSTQQIEEQIEFYLKAIDLVQGPYLNDMYLDGVTADRERLDQQYLGALITLAGLYQKQAKLNEALSICQRAVDYQAFYEAAYHLMMQIHHRLGNRAAVIQTYEACKTALRKHLNMPPSPETEALYRKSTT
jgi:ATP/maltotriose-dependent transcriptional regulator MalT/two-component SAPR family response regulator